MGRRHAAISLMFATLCWVWLLQPSAHAQEYRFSVPEMQVVLTVQPDASVLIEYRMTFQNQPGAHAIDVVDVGMPTKNYEVLEASIDGTPLSSWGPSTYIETGPEIRLGPYAIPAGSRGVFECRARVTDFVYEDRTDSQRASLRFTPTWFGDRYVVGETDLLLVVRFPQGVHPDNVVWHSNERTFFQKGVLDPDDVPFVAWKERYRLTGPMMFGCSFPRVVMQRVVRSSLLREFVLWWEQSRSAQQVSGMLFLVVFAGWYLLLTRGTGISVLLIGICVLVFAMVLSPVLHLCLWLLTPAMAGSWYVAVHRHKPRYLPALARVEAGKICRGLTPPEAAVLLDVPPDRVLSMVLTGLLSKGVVRVTQAEPLQVAAVGTRPALNIVELPDGLKVSLEPYEVGFLAALSGPPQEFAKQDFSEPFRKLVGLVKYRMSGFDADTTRAYYCSVTARAWNQMSREEDPKKKDDMANRRLGWLSMADDYDDRMENQRARGWRYRPWWYYGAGHYRDGDRARDITRSVRTAAERSAQGIVVHQSKGIDLSSVDHFTLDALRGLAESGGGGSGCVGGGCACACAGCACACACAGGGR